MASPPPCPQPRTPCQPPRAISPCPTGAEAGLVSCSSQPCPVQTGDTWLKTSTATRLSWYYISWLMLWRDMLLTSLVFQLGHSPLCCCGYTEISELAASLRWLVRSIFIRTLTVAEKEMGLVKQKYLAGVTRSPWVLIKFKVFSQIAIIKHILNSSMLWIYRVWRKWINLVWKSGHKAKSRA